MKKTLLTILFGFIVYLPSIAQTISVAKHDTTAYYMRDDYFMATSEADAKSLRLIIKADSGLFRIEDYYMDATPKMLAYSFSDKMNFETGTQGKRIDYYPNGKKRIVSYYKSGQEVGGKELYYPNGNLYTVTMLESADIYLKRCLDSAGKVLTDNGNGKWIDFDSSFKFKTEGRVINGKREGDWVEITPDGGNNKGVYKNGVLIYGNLLANDTVVYKSADVPPAFKGGDAELNRYLSRNIKYPKEARDNNIKGRVTIGFIVEKDGTLTNVKLVRGIGGGCDEEAVRAMSVSPKWNPGLNSGKPVRVRYSIPVAYALSE